MTQEQKRILIAEACGYQERGGGPEGIYYTHDDREDELLFDELPDYFNDLNACHEMENALTELEFGNYHDILLNQHMSVKFISATATQRAEAFGRTLGLWT